MAKRKNKKAKQAESDTRYTKLTPIVKSLLGVINLPPDFDYKKEYAEYLWKKYGDGLEEKR